MKRENVFCRGLPLAQQHLPHIRVAHQLSPRGRQVKLEFARFHIFAEGRHFAARSTWNAQHCSGVESEALHAQSHPRLVLQPGNASNDFEVNMCVTGPYDQAVDVGLRKILETDCVHSNNLVVFMQDSRQPVRRASIWVHAYDFKGIQVADLETDACHAQCRWAVLGRAIHRQPHFFFVVEVNVDAADLHAHRAMFFPLPIGALFEVLYSELQVVASLFYYIVEPRDMGGLVLQDDVLPVIFILQQI
mmetsp:Transcript_55072/g.80863  ORF Transcript_55072/g.80863 Transcript_55072/m.80863 type:complete len:247 (-) Transcript_55072:529-1269(-)